MIEDKQRIQKLIEDWVRTRNEYAQVPKAQAHITETWKRIFAIIEQYNKDYNTSFNLWGEDRERV